VVWRLLTGETVETVVEPPEHVAAFLRDHLADVENLFSPEHLDETTRALKDLQRTRAKERFG
jgi:hypothetical protein